ncbi:DNA replication complex GINS protein PSF3, partial [Linnemannia zychae]
MEDYYDIDSILAEDQNVKCVFQKNIQGLAWLEGGHDDTLKAGSRLDIPFWLARELVEQVDDMALSGVMEKAFKARLQMTMDHTQSGGNNNATTYLDRLDETERELYKAGMESSASLQKWNQQSFGRIRSASEMLLKRKA